MDQRTRLLDEQALVAALQRKEEAAFEQLYTHYSAAIYGVVLRIIGKSETAQDILQESFVKAWKNIHRYDRSKGKLFTWLLNIARNTAIDVRRSAAFRYESEIRSDFDLVSEGKGGSTEIPVDHIGLKEVLAQLDDPLIEVIEMCYFQGWSHSEAAKRLDLPLGTVKSRIRQAMKILRTKLL